MFEKDDYGNVFKVTEKSKEIVGTFEKSEKVRLDADTVEDIFYRFDLVLGEYVEQSRTPINEPLPQPEETDAEKIAKRMDAAEDAIMALMDLGMM